MPPAVVTVMSTVPALSAGLTALIWVSEMTVYKAAAALPNFTADAAVNPVPDIVTDVPPATVPWFGLTDVTMGGTTKVNWSAADVAEAPLGSVTVISTVAALSAGLTAVICVAELMVKEVAAVAPKLTPVARLKFVPVTVTDVPPVVGPEIGLTAVTVASGR